VTLLSFRTNPAASTLAVRDFIRGVLLFRLAAFLAWDDIRRRYIRTLLGPLWIVITTGVWFSAMGIVMVNLFDQNLQDYLPFIASGLLVWLFISTSIVEGTQVLIAAASLISSFPIPIFTHYLRFLLRNGIIFLHNAVILLVVICLYPPHPDAAMWLVIPGFLLDAGILLGVAIILSFMNLRWRDTNLLVLSAMQVLPFVTPVFWDKPMLRQHKWIADVNPFYHMIEIVRAPSLGRAPAALSWEVTMAAAILSLSIAAFLFMRYRHRVIFWL
jgi:lipopolysaccharide transport system permease protein